jgi:dTDP-4-dehydrorhamnose reductase
VLDVPGWWKRPERLIYGFSRNDDGRVMRAESRIGSLHKVVKIGKIKPVLITGARGTLGRAFARICAARGIPCRLLSRAELDIADHDSVKKVLVATRPWAIINAAGYVRVDDAENDRERSYRENTIGPAVLADECANRGISLVTFSSDLVFSGASQKPYVESDPVDPLNLYGLQKVKAEERVLARMPGALIIRSSAFFGPWDEHNFVTVALRTLALNHEFRAAADVTVSPTYVPDLVNACLDLLIDGESGIWHVANEGEISWATLAETAAHYAHVSTRKLVHCELRDLKLPARRPQYSALGSERALLLPSLDRALQRFVADCEMPWSGYSPSETLAA